MSCRLLVLCRDSCTVGILRLILRRRAPAQEHHNARDMHDAYQQHLDETPSMAVRRLASAGRKTAQLRKPIEAIATASSQKVLAPAPSPGRHSPPLIRHGAKDRELGVEVLGDVHDGRDVAAAVAVIWCGPDCHDVFLFEVVLRRS